MKGHEGTVAANETQHAIEWLGKPGMSRDLLNALMQESQAGDPNWRAGVQSLLVNEAWRVRTEPEVIKAWVEEIVAGYLEVIWGQSRAKLLAEKVVEQDLDALSAVRDYCLDCIQDGKALDMGQMLGPAEESVATIQSERPGMGFVDAAKLVTRRSCIQSQDADTIAVGAGNWTLSPGDFINTYLGRIDYVTLEESLREVMLESVEAYNQTQEVEVP